MSLLSLLILIIGSWHIWEELTKKRPWVLYLTKPLTMILIITMTWLNGTTDAYTYLILAGLVCSLIGDVFLLSPQKFFIQGLLSFLVAHVFYIVAFTQRGIAVSPTIAVPIALVALGMVGFLSDSLEKALKLPVVIYISIIAIMAILAVSLWHTQPNTRTLQAATGALLFMASDSTLAYQQFKRRFRYDQSVIMVTYFAAQWLIALSV